MQKSAFKFRKNDRIGTAGAEEDTEFLSKCFVDTGELSLLEDVLDCREIVLGRTGSGKSALLIKLAERKQNQVIQISPESLALTYLSNSTILNFFAHLGVNLDPFFKLLWRHVFTVEILRHHLHDSPEQHKTLSRWLADMFTGNSRHDKEMREAVQYLKNWGESFWEETEFRVKEITQKVEAELSAEFKAHAGIGISEIGASSTATAAALGRLTEEKKAELVKRGQNVVSAAQVQDLHKVIKLLDNVLQDRQKPYYVVIDNLDHNWVDEKIRYKLIMALILTAREFVHVNNAKIIVALRRDLIERVFRLTRDSGFQEEKFQSCYIPLVWTKDNLLDVLDKRVDALVKHRYTKESVTHKDFLPRSYDGIPITDYIMERVARPRDVIGFFNACIAAATDLSRLTNKAFAAAEAEYSRSTLRALGDEWSSEYPLLLEFTAILKGRPASFKVSTISDEEVESLALEVATKRPEGGGLLETHAVRLVDCALSTASLKTLLVRVFFQIGLVGLKLEPHETAYWVDEQRTSISSAEVSNETSVVVHPMYHRALGISSRS